MSACSRSMAICSAWATCSRTYFSVVAASCPGAVLRRLIMTDCTISFRFHWTASCSREPARICVSSLMTALSRCKSSAAVDVSESANDFTLFLAACSLAISPISCGCVAGAWLGRGASGGRSASDSSTRAYAEVTHPWPRHARPPAQRWVRLLGIPAASPFATQDKRRWKGVQGSSGKRRWGGAAREWRRRGWGQAAGRGEKVWARHAIVGRDWRGAAAALCRGRARSLVEAGGDAA
eukprot:scaffold11144_cov111-Isochrysis_galbana.AAC.5